jgi:hypothetical protein
MLLLDDSSPDAVVVEPAAPKSASALRDALGAQWPRLQGRVSFVDAELEQLTIANSDVIVSCHACGALTDRVLDAAIAARARVAVLPCCHDEETCDAGGLTGWLDAPTAIDVTRARRLAAAGYHVRTQVIPADVTPKNRLLLGEA